WNVPDAEPSASMNTPVPICTPSSATGPSSAPAAKRPVVAAVTERSSLLAPTDVVRTASPRTIARTEVSRFIALSRLFDLNIAATQCATGHVAVAHDDREGVVFAGLAVVADVHLESEAWGPVDLRVAKDAGATARFPGRHGRDL